MLAVLQFPRSEPPLWPFFPAEQATLKLGLLLGADAPPQIGQVHRLRQLGTPGKPSKYHGLEELVVLQRAMPTAGE